ncbi:hypothetical protein ACQRUO_32370, partial [Kitasatospora sp. LaBMicrA B282]
PGPGPAAVRAVAAQGQGQAAAGQAQGAAGQPLARSARFDRRGFPRHRAPGLVERHRRGGDLHERTVLVRQRALTTGVLAAVLSAPVTALWLVHRDGAATAATAAVTSVHVADGSPEAAAPTPAPQAALPPASGPVARSTSPTDSALAAAVVRPSAPAVGGGAGAGSAGSGGAGAETLLPPLQGAAVPVPAPNALPISDPVLHGVPVPAPPVTPATQLAVEAGAYGNRTVLTLTDTGDTPVDWRAVPNCDWLRLSRDAGTLAPGQRITVIVTVDDQRAPHGHWTADISLPPSDAVVTLTGDSGGTPTPTPTPSGVPATPTPSATANPSGVASPTPSETPAPGSSSASSAPSSSASPSASPTSAPPSGSSAPPSPSSPPSPRPTVSPTGSPAGPAPSSTPTSATSKPSPSSPAR